MSRSSRRVAGALGVLALLSLPGYAADYPASGPAAPASRYPLVTAALSNAMAQRSRTTNWGRGETLYSTHCAVCHQANGEGVAGAFPPLKGSAVVNKAEATKHIDVVLSGLQGARVSGVTYANPMPAFGATLSDSDIAAIVDYERTAWGNHGRLITPAQVASERARLK